MDYTLAAKSQRTEIYGISIQGFLNFCKETWWIQIIGTLVSMFLGALIGKLVSGWFATKKSYLIPVRSDSSLSFHHGANVAVSSETRHFLKP
jgi:hypothetical protein